MVFIQLSLIFLSPEALNWVFCQRTIRFRCILDKADHCLVTNRFVKVHTGHFGMDLVLKFAIDGMRQNIIGNITPQSVLEIGTESQTVFKGDYEHLIVDVEP